jgi:hypothetical protein
MITTPIENKAQPAPSNKAEQSPATKTPSQPKSGDAISKAARNPK